jgi:galactokinase
MDSGFDVLFYGNLPVGAGLSSSASIELATAVMLNDLFALNAPMLELVKLSQQAENQYMGLNSGIMDQFAIGFGKKHQAIYLNTDTLEYEYVPLKLQGHSIIIASTNKPRTLVDSKYNERFSECKQALAILQQKLKVDNLCQITPDEFEKNKYLIEDYTLSRRAWHVIYENQRTQLAVKFLEDHDLKAFGQLLSQSHLSLKRDYDVTGLELDTLVEAAWRQDGVIGARMTGAGFGGCTINFVKNGFEDNFMSKVSAQYKEITGLDADFYIVESSDGASKILD